MSSQDAGDMSGAVEAVLVPSNELPKDAYELFLSVTILQLNL